jgi:hypothetical protein
MDKNTVISMLVGAIASALVSWFFYWLGGRSLAKEAQRLHDLNVLLLRAFEEAGLATLNRDASGQPIGLVLQGAAVMESVSASDACDAEIIRSSPNMEATGDAVADAFTQHRRRSREAALAMFGPNASAPKD